jgi:hypothetical protein
MNHAIIDQSQRPLHTTVAVFLYVAAFLLGWFNYLFVLDRLNHFLSSALLIGVGLLLTTLVIAFLRQLFHGRLWARRVALCFSALSLPGAVSPLFLTLSWSLDEVVEVVQCLIFTAAAVLLLSKESREWFTRQRLPSVTS